MTDKKISPETVKEFLEIRKASENCCYCNQSVWRILVNPIPSTGEPEEINKIVLQGSGDHLMGFGAIIMNCVNCGNVRYILADTMKEWLKNE